MIRDDGKVFDVKKFRTLGDLYGIARYPDYPGPG